jgi:Ca2+-binding RTX toxin-like protein
MSIALLAVAGLALAALLPLLSDDDEAGEDPIEGTDQPDTLPGTDGDDILLGLAGDDLVQAAAGDDSAEGGGGNDTLEGGDGDDTLQGGRNRDGLFGGTGNDVLEDVTRDETGFDIDEPGLLDGGEGDDRLRGGGGDRLMGSAGRDTFVVDTEGAYHGYPTIADLTPGEDRIEIEYDPDDGPPPGFEVVPDDSVAGANSFLEVNGTIVAYILGEFGFDPADVTLVPVRRA